MSEIKTSDKKSAKKREKEYYAYVAEKIKEFNGNGKLTVAIFCDAFFPNLDGVVMVVDNLAKRLNEKCNVVVIAPKDKGLTVKRDYLVIGVKSVFFKKYNYNAALFSAIDFNFKKLIKSLRIDVIHAHSPFFLGAAAKRLCKKRNIPFIMSFHSQYKKDIYRSTGSKFLTKIILAKLISVYNGADETWTMHDKSAETLRDYGYKGKISLIPNATDYVYPTNAEDIILNVKNNYGIKKEKVFLFVGRLILQKNVLFIIDVLAALKDKGLNFKMFFVGDGPDRETLEKKIEKNNLKKDVLLVGNVSDKEIIKSFYLTADLVLFPSKYDVSSIIQLEAAAMKTPCAFLEGSVTSYTVKSGENGLILPENAISFADGVYKFVNDEKEKTRVSENAYRDLYVTWDEIVDKSLEKYTAIAEEYKNKK